jgi:hypothetical protein
MTTITFTDAAVQTPFDDVAFDGAQLAAVSFLARYSGRTLEAYRQDLRDFFQWGPPTRRRGSAAHQLRDESVDLHLVVLVVGPSADCALDHVADCVDGFAFPDADPEVVCARGSMDGERHVGRKPGLEGLGFGGLEALCVMDSMDDGHEHGCLLADAE